MKWKNARYPAVRSGIVDVPILALDSLIFIVLAFYGILDIVPLIVGEI